MMLRVRYKARADKPLHVEWIGYGHAAGHRAPQESMVHAGCRYRIKVRRCGTLSAAADRRPKFN
jgi:hypothetical protein